MRQTRLLTLLALLMTAATGAWAQSATTHVVTNDNVNSIFSGDGYTLGDAVAAGDVLDFQGEIDLGADASHDLVVNKRVTIISSTHDAVINLRTVSQSMMGEAPGNSFVINKAASGTTVEGIRFDNTQLWIYNTSNVTFTNVTYQVEGVRLGAGVGGISIRFCDHVTLDGCTIYVKNNGGSSALTLNACNNCTIQNSSFEGESTVGNLLYLGNEFNLDGDMPADFGNNYKSTDCTVLNCTIKKIDTASAICMFIVGGLRHHIEGCTIENLSVSSGWGTTTPTSVDEGHTFLNNTFICSTTLPVYSTAENNTVKGSFTVSTGVTATGNSVTGDVTVKQDATLQGNTITGNVSASGADAIVQGNTINGNVTVSANSSDYTGSTITGNAINGTVTFASNSKNNTLTRNVITSTGDYAVVMASTADANNTVQYNTLIAATKKGDEAVNLSNSSGNTISYNSNIALMLADGTKDAANWTATVNGEQPNPLPVGGLSNGDAVTLKYNGRLKVKSVTATTDYDPLATPLTIEAVTPGTIQVYMTGTLSSGMKYSVNGGTKTLITESTDITVAKDDKVQFYGNGTQTKVYGGKTVVSIQGTGDGFQTKVYGNIMSLLDETGFATKTDLPEADYVFFGLFKNNTTLTDASELLLPATTLTNACYQQMFDGCTNLTKAPKLPAMTLADGCYAYMFSGCQLLTAAPKLPATTLDISCYYCMFNGCTSLTSAYVKAAYTGVNAECASMFDGCTADGAVLHTTPDNKARWEAKMGSGKEWPTWSVADDWQE